MFRILLILILLLGSCAGRRSAGGSVGYNATGQPVMRVASRATDAAYDYANTHLDVDYVDIQMWTQTVTHRCTHDTYRVTDLASLRALTTLQEWNVVRDKLLAQLPAAGFVCKELPR